MKKIIVLIGSAPNWEHDFNNLCMMICDFDVMAIGMSCQYEGKVDWFATYHVKDLPVYREKREKGGFNTDYRIITHDDHVKDREDFPQIIIPYKPPSGSSALLGTFAAIKLGYEKIILCGCPLEGVNAKKSSYQQFRKGWIHHQKSVIGFTKSMSGWTRELLGSPDIEWLRGEIK